MTTVLDVIPEQLRGEVDAAVDWFNAREGATFEPTGIIDPRDDALADGTRGELRLVLCGEGTCRQESFSVARSADALTVDRLEAPGAPGAGDVATLDPPPGVRRNWINETAAQHAFTLILFYRGFW